MSARITIHITFWVTYVLLKTFLNFESTQAPVNCNAGMGCLILILYGQLTLLAVKLPLVYTLFHVMDKYLSRNWPLFQSIAVTSFLFVASTFLFVVLSDYVVLKIIYEINPNPEESFTLGSIAYSFFILCFPSGIAIAIKVIRLNIKQKEIAQELLKNKLETELNLLKSQVNPHFLFNTLNNIYGLALKESKETAPIVLKLSKIMRFLLYESEKKSIQISEEIKLIEDYIELETLRYNDRLKITFTKSIDNESVPITPLLLLPLVENAFKHGASESRKNAFIYIDLNLKNNQFAFSIINSTEGSDEEISGQGIGLKNVKRQLELVYKNFNFDVKKNSDSFEVKLNINLNSNAV